jgi:hypothetical protein
MGQGHPHGRHALAVVIEYALVKGQSSRMFGLVGYHTVKGGQSLDEISFATEFWCYVFFGELIKELHKLDTSEGFLHVQA